MCELKDLWLHSMKGLLIKLLALIFRLAWHLLFLITHRVTDCVILYLRETDRAQEDLDQGKYIWVKTQYCYMSGGGQFFFFFFFWLIPTPMVITLSEISIWGVRTTKKPRIWPYFGPRAYNEVSEGKLENFHGRYIKELTSCSFYIARGMEDDLKIRKFGKSAILSWSWSTAELFTLL